MFDHTDPQSVASELEFRNWMDAVDEFLGRNVGGLHHNDLPDFCWRDAFDSGADPDEAAKEMLQEEGLWL